MMTRYINADKILSHLNDEIKACGDCYVYSQPVVYGTYLGLTYARSVVETAETADVQEVRHGRWIDLHDENVLYEQTYKCSACGEWFVIEAGTPKENGYKYCPNCGARMDGEKK